MATELQALLVKQEQGEKLLKSKIEDVNAKLDKLYVTQRRLQRMLDEEGMDYMDTDSKDADYKHTVMDASRRQGLDTDMQDTVFSVDSYEEHRGELLLRLQVDIGGNLRLCMMHAFPSLNLSLFLPSYVPVNVALLPINIRPLHG